MLILGDGILISLARASKTKKPPAFAPTAENFDRVAKYSNAGTSLALWSACAGHARRNRRNLLPTSYRSFGRSKRRGNTSCNAIAGQLNARKVDIYADRRRFTMVHNMREEEANFFCNEVLEATTALPTM